MMKMMKMRMIKLKCVAVLAVVLLSGCKKAEELEDSVNNRWQQMIVGDYQQAYEYMTPAYRNIESLAAFSLRTESAKLKVNWINAIFKSKQCQEDFCKVIVELEYKYSFPRRSMGQVQLKTEVSENWILINKKWHFVPSEQNEIK